MFAAAANPVEAAEGYIGGSTTLGNGMETPGGEYEWSGDGKLNRVMSNRNPVGTPYSQY